MTLAAGLGMVADTTALGLRERVLLRLAKHDQTQKIAAMQSVTEASALALDVERVSIWHLTEDAGAIVCEDLYRRNEQQHDAGIVLMSRDYPRYFKALLESRTIRADDACGDFRTAEFAEPYLRPRGITSMMDVPIWHRGALYGVLCHEHTGSLRHWRDEEAEFAGNLADIMSGGLEACERHDAERRWTTLVESVSEAVFVIDDELTIRQMNVMGRQLLERLRIGVTDAERGRDVGYRDQLGRDIPRDQRPVERAARGEQVNEIVELVSKQRGPIGWFRFHVTPVDCGEQRNLVAVVSDVTEDVRFERLKSEFLSALAHELKTPVTIVRGYAQLLLAEPRLPEPVAASMRATANASRRTERLIEDALDISALTMGRLSLTRERVDLSMLVTSVVEQVKQTAPDHRVRLTTPGRVDLLADRIRIEQVLRRLLDNAVRYSRPGSDIHVDVGIDGRYATVAVRDHGIGVPADKQHVTFDVFARVHAGTPDDRGGLGIGLYLARELVRLHGGDIWVDSEVGRGSTFTFQLPREVPP